MGLQVVILAAGEGSRMRSAMPKVLHLLAGKTLLEHVVATARSLDADGIHIIFGSRGNKVRARMQHLDVNWIEQKERLGTGHAVSQALPYFKEDDQVLVLYGDVPLISKPTLEELLSVSPKDGVGIVGADVDDPTGLGRIIRDASGNIQGIIEERDTNEKEACIREVYTGILTAPARRLLEWLPRLKDNNSQGEFYLTDVIKFSVQAKCSVIGVMVRHALEAEGVNDRHQLADLERYYQHQAAHDVMKRGASIMDPARFDLRGELEVGEDVIIDVNVLLEGKVMIGANSVIGPNCVIRNSRIGENVVLKANSVVDDSEIEDDSVVGPFARVRPGTVVGRGSKIGNFVETKNAKLGLGVKISHLSYIGDATLGNEVNIGAGTITCNYDGANKHQTTIGAGAFIGSDTQLIAPLTIGEGANIGAGSTITKDAPANKLSLSRSDQVVVENWKRPKKNEQ